MRLREPLAGDESHWFVEALRRGIMVFEDCPEGCFRRKRWNASGPDHFTTPAGRPRHLFSRPDLTEASLNREYIPHIAAYA
ncbi:MAG: hypothetical protein M3252_01660, partial [Actinomycetota bacterium]|nr:hypothetical protein [Actinomycetota bacterium]